MRLTPILRASCTAETPSPPKPMMPRDSVLRISASFSACHAVAVEHIMIAAWSNGTSGGIAIAFCAGTTIRSAYPPSTSLPIMSPFGIR